MTNNTAVWALLHVYMYLAAPLICSFLYMSQHLDDEDDEDEDDGDDDDDESDTNDDELDTDMIDDRDSPDEVSIMSYFVHSNLLD